MDGETFMMHISALYVKYPYKMQFSNPSVIVSIQNESYISYTYVELIILSHQYIFLLLFFLMH